ncbi:MAG: SOS response-associated peptidase [Anaerolineales bacterium]|nr:SOS response-associated peptidase [Anaerolineales bacterium]
MCGRFTLATNTQKLAEAFAEFEVPADLPPRYNVAPSQPVAVVANNGQHKVEFFQWGLIPSWAKDPKIGNQMINARAETLAEKASFKNAYKRRRCLVLADGFYEWKKEGDNTKTPVYIRLASGEPFAFGGLWEMWQTAEDFILSCTIITTSPNELMAQIHNRMPLILPREAYEQWLDPAERTPDQLNSLLKPYPAELMTAYPVSRLVNSPKNDSPALIEPVDS